MIDQINCKLGSFEWSFLPNVISLFFTEMESLPISLALRSNSSERYIAVSRSMAR